MGATLTRPFPEPPPAPAAECAGRLALGMAVVALLFGLLVPAFSRVTDTTPAGGLALLRAAPLGVFILACAMVQGARPSAAFLLSGGLGACAAGLWLQFSGASGAGPGFLLARVETSAFGALLLGTGLARGLRSPADLLTVVLCAAAGDAWFTVLRVPESVSELHPARWLRPAWPPTVGGLSLAPSFTDLLFCALYLEATRRLALRRVSTACGALLGYGLASALSLSSWQAMPALPLLGLGVLTGAWPRLRCSAGEVFKALALAFLLCGVLLGLAGLRRYLHPQPKPHPDLYNSRNLAEAGRRPAGVAGP